MGQFITIVLFIIGFFNYINAQERKTIDGQKCEFPFAYNNSIYNDCILIDGQESCQVDQEYKICQPPDNNNNNTDNNNIDNNNTNNNNNNTDIDCTYATKSGCKCLNQWSHMGRVQYGCASPDADPNGPWCLIQENSCQNGDPFGKNSTPQFDYCRAECGPEKSLPRQIQNRDLNDCSITQGYCICQDQWSYRGKQYEGCSNPDEDSIGSWCIVTDGGECSPRGNLRSSDQTSVMGFLFGLPTQGDSPSWDYCQRACGPQNVSQNSNQIQIEDVSVMGVFDKQELPLDTLSFLPDLPEYIKSQFQDDKNQQQSNNNYYNQSDQNDQNYSDQQQQSSNNSDIFNQPPEFQSPPPPPNIFLPPPTPQTEPSPPTPNFQDKYTDQYTDQNTQPTPLSIPIPGPPTPPAPPSYKNLESSPQLYNIEYYIDLARSISLDDNPQKQTTKSDVCLQTQNGCNCRSNGWNWDGDGDGNLGWFLGCAKTLDQDRPWCQINNISECKNTPFSSTWDYCEQSCTLSTYSACTVSSKGCRCLEEWYYDGMKQRGCTRPDAELEFNWCVVDKETCTEGGAEGELNTGELWDRCPDQC